MTRFKPSDDREPGTWKECVYNWKRTAMIVCPECGTWILLDNHSIDVIGAVTPRIVCDHLTYYGALCPFNDDIVLSNWRVIDPSL
jgi:hypothetical protein